MATFHFFRKEVIMSSFKSKYQSFDELYETTLRGNEIEFKYNEKFYFILPYFKDKKVVGVSMGQFNADDEKVCYSKQELYDVEIDDMVFGEILDSIDILWDNF